MLFFARPSAGSGCKRLNLFLRWMVRKDAVDPGGWTSIPRSKLIVPLDTHVIRLGRCLRLTRYASPGWPMAADITASLRAIDPVDPVRFDFSICHVGNDERLRLRPPAGRCAMSAEGNLPAARARSRGGAATAGLIVAFVVASVAFAGGWFLGARRTVMTVQSPAHDAVAYVFEARCAAGLCQSLWIGKDMKHAKMAEMLSGPSEQAGEIAWTQDGTRVAFIVNGYQLRLFDARTGANLGAVAIIDPDGFPSSRIARGVTFSANAAAVTFDDCPLPSPAAGRPSSPSRSNGSTGRLCGVPVGRLSGFNVRMQATRR